MIFTSNIQVIMGSRVRAWSGGLFWYSFADYLYTKNRRPNDLSLHTIIDLFDPQIPGTLKNLLLYQYVCHILNFVSGPIVTSTFSPNPELADPRTQCFKRCSAYSKPKFESSCKDGFCVCHGKDYQLSTCLRKFTHM